MRWFRAVMLLALLLPAAAGEAGVRVPLENHGGALVAQVTVNRRFTGRFLVDTGATYCVVSKEVARKAKIRGRVGGKRVRLVTANGEIEASLGEARRVDVGRARARDVAVAVVDADPVPGLDGILGLSFLERFRYTLDPEAGLLVLEK
ncbi:retropepsin-like aspartic protease family protein [Deferrisoma camini]|uniref:retropepsin-like aspartic protease family protein n=1 Tax=Deferrisoma camini TaxID=1035120 RepID=UPI00046CF7F4|nr:retropepsin-like aspartic protease [Deferrisoma camini]